jgi:predicted DNA-binding protein
VIRSEDRRSHHTEEVEVMSNEDTPNGGGKVKTLAIRLEMEVHAQLSLIAQLKNSTITDEIRSAIEAHIAATKAAPELAGKADAVLEDIEREAASRREAIATLFGNSDTESQQPASGSRSRSRKPAQEEAPSSEG